MRTLSLQDKIIEIFLKTDDFCNAFEHEFAKHQLSGNEDTPKILLSNNDIAKPR